MTEPDLKARDLKAHSAELEKATNFLLSQAIKAGAEHAEVCSAFRTTSKVGLEKQDYHMASAEEAHSIGLRVLVDGRQGFSSTNSLDSKELKSIAQSAVKIARISPSNPHWQILGCENVAANAPKPPSTDEIEGLSFTTLGEWTRLLFQTSTEDSRFRINDGSVSTDLQVFLVSNSRGTRKLESEASVHWGLMGMGVAGEAITSFDYFSGMSRRASDVPAHLVDSTKAFCTQVLSCLQQGPATSYVGTVMLSPRAVRDVVFGAIEYHLNGRVIAEGTGRWKRADLGAQKLSSQLSLWDRPWQPDRLGYSLFDREGVPTRNSVLIEKGRVLQFLVDSYSSHVLDLPVTGHAAGGPSGPPSAGSHLLEMDGGTQSLMRLTQEASQQNPSGDFLLVNRFSGQVDPVTGDFSGVAKGGEWWSKGEKVHTVQETLISGNLFDCLGNGFVGASIETQVLDGAEKAPYVVLNGVSVTAQ